MNFDDTPQEAAFRQEVRAWLAANAPHELDDELRNAPLFSLELKSVDPLTAAKAWQKKKYEAGLVAWSWPKDYGGREATPIQQVIWSQEEGHYARLSTPFSIGQGMVGPTLMTYASEDQKRRYLPRIASGEDLWCQLFSEPAAGSDLAGIITRADRDGDDWIVNGQKVWTSWAHKADHGIILTRTDFAAPKHKGLTMFFLDMKAPGVEVRPLRQMNEKRVFNEVYFNDVRIPDANRLGEVNAGWRVSLTTLMNERFSAASLPTGFEELFKLCQTTRDASGERLVDNPVVRAKLAHWAAINSGLHYTAQRGITALSRGREPGPESSIGKLAAASTLQATVRYALELMGPEGMLLNADQAHGGGWFQAMFLRSPALRIEAGSDEILRNIVAERVLGMPGEQRSDKDVPFNEIPR